MFDNILRELDRLSRPFEFSVPVGSDDQGYMDRECPSDQCRYMFKVLADDWRERFKDESVFCPRCGHGAPATEWNTVAQIEHGKELALRHIKGRIGDALKLDARAKSSSTNLGGLLNLKVSMSYSGPSGPVLLIPARAREELEQKLQCGACSARFAVLGSAFFCPCCGTNSVEEIFDATLERISTNVSALQSLRASVAAAGDRDQADQVCMLIVESSLQECVTAFQALCAQLYSRIRPSQPAPRNAFQSLDHGNELWEGARGLSYSRVLSGTELARLRVLFQRRHLLAHTQGMVDADYLERSADTTYVAGQRIVVTPEDVTSLVAIVRKLGVAVREATALASSPKDTPQ